MLGPWSYLNEPVISSNFAIIIYILKFHYRPDVRLAPPTPL